MKHIAIVLLCVSPIILASCNQSPAPTSANQTPIPNVIAPAASYHADWSNQPAFIQAALAVQDQHTPDLMAIPGVIGTGTGLDLTNPGQAAILVFTEHPGVAGIPAFVGGVKTRVEMIGTVSAFSGYTGTYRTPCPAGVSVGDNDECASGSIGALVTTSRLTSSGSYSGTYEASGSSKDVLNVYGYSYAPSSFSDGTPKFMLSCNHVFANENSATSADQMDQPGRYDVSCGTSGAIGKLYAWNYIDSRHNNYYDAALAECNPGLSGGWNPQMSPDNWYTPTTTVVSPSAGLSVKKVGRTTGYTTGSIAGINVTITVSYTHFKAKFVDQIYVSGQFIQAGDSGSMMVDANGNPVGLNFAGSSTSSFANRMDHIAQDFGLGFVTSGF
ncbi:MAG: hypothetical protein Q8922_05570 [Bacteroidota bacterium]|nr:hypothetical protein [Bacteroidota bacterium]MDP4233128.1 hypothetical protein [Bacteroidota bacterium]MDP4241727.1 hypothetical protein [Bacteroidota bacterium]MDP4287385.1 hypothetical protein [Bacteroidota bacterium]